MVAVDPVASLRITTTYVDLGGRTFEVGKHSAADWLDLILTGELYHVLPGWVEDRNDSYAITEMLLDGEITEDDIDKAIREVITIAGGRQHWWIFNLVGVARATNTSWSVLNGRLIQAGIDADQISLAAWIDALYSTCVEMMQGQEHRVQFDTHLEAPPAGTELDEEEEGEAFLALMDTM